MSTSIDNKRGWSLFVLLQNTRLQIRPAASHCSWPLWALSSGVYTKSRPGAMKEGDILLALSLPAHQWKPKDELSIWGTSRLHNPLISSKCAVIPGDNCSLYTRRAFFVHSESRWFRFGQRSITSARLLGDPSKTSQRPLFIRLAQSKTYTWLSYSNMRHEEARVDISAQVPL